MSTMVKLVIYSPITNNLHDDDPSQKHTNKRLHLKFIYTYIFPS
jgi:hypothetical protein